jgi:predicted nucleic acid-binding protein
LVAYANEEVGADVVLNVFDLAGNGDIELYINKYNLLEVYYGMRRADGIRKAEELIFMVLELTIYIIECLSDDVFLEAGRLKSSYKMSLADSIALGEASVMGASLVTSDHHEFDTVEKNENISFTWIR